MNAHQIALFWDLALNAYDRGEFGIETLSSMVRALKSTAETAGILAEVQKIHTELRRANYEAPV